MKSQYEASAVPVLRLHNAQDRDGHIIPPECHLTYLDSTKRVPVVFDDAKQEQVGWVTLYRRADTLYGDFKLISRMTPVSAALGLMRSLTPGIGFEVHDSYSNIILMIRVTHVLVTTKGNSDPGIAAFGNRLHCLSRSMLN